jgi:hypothetical protein
MLTFNENYNNVVLCLENMVHNSDEYVPLWSEGMIVKSHHRPNALREISINKEIYFNQTENELKIGASNNYVKYILVNWILWNNVKNWNQKIQLNRNQTQSRKQLKLK